jgi:hypothetical protein
MRAARCHRLAWCTVSSWCWSVLLLECAAVAWPAQAGKCSQVSAHITSRCQHWQASALQLCWRSQARAWDHAQSLVLRRRCGCLLCCCRRRLLLGENCSRVNHAPRCQADVQLRPCWTGTQATLRLLSMPSLAGPGSTGRGWCGTCGASGGVRHWRCCRLRVFLRPGGGCCCCCGGGVEPSRLRLAGLVAPVGLQRLQHMPCEAMPRPQLIDPPPLLQCSSSLSLGLHQHTRAPATYLCRILRTFTRVFSMPYVSRISAITRSV